MFVELLKWECAAPDPIKQPDVEPQAHAGLWLRLDCAGNRDEGLDLINEKIILVETYLNCCGFERLFEPRSNPGVCPNESAGAKADRRSDRG
jgi:hypothetical protein